MRLLKHSPSGNFELVSFNDDSLPPYAILSHTWAQGEEVTYDELVAGAGKSKAGYEKIRFCGEQAVTDGLQYFWVDSCCIDKSNSVELSTAINSMFRWYQHANRCYVHLSDVFVPEEVSDVDAFPITWKGAFRGSRWFTRGWALQELLAPGSVEFFSKEGKRLGSKISLEQDIHEITKIPVEALRGQSLNEFSMEERMSWAANRITTWKEDKVYCLLGIFGIFLSPIYGEGESHATLRFKEEIQRRQGGQETKSLHNLSVSSMLPFGRNESFVGREDKLQSLEQYLLVPNTHRRMTIYGLGGCGKSALALEFAYRAMAKHASRLVFWVPAISRESFELAYRDIGVRLRVPGITDNNADIRKLLKETLSSGSFDDWLMIIDNVDDPEVLSDEKTNGSMPVRFCDWLPHDGRGTILFTTRSRKVAAYLTQSNVLELTDMGEAEARQLLARRVTNQGLLDDDAAVNELLELLACLPLAIVQAAAFISNNDLPISEYISLFRQTGMDTELLSEHFEDPSRYPELDSTIAKTWCISFDQIRKQDQLAADYLSFMSCIDRANIPQSLLPLGEDSLVRQAKALGTLTGYAFITERQQTIHRVDGERFFDMHRLVHMASAWWLEGHGRRATWAGTAADRLEKLVPVIHHHIRREVWTTYLPHAIYVAGLDGITGDLSRASLFDRVGRCQESVGQFLAAERSHRQALSVRQMMPVNNEEGIVFSKIWLGWALQKQGRYKEAETLLRKTLAQAEKALGPENQQTLMSKDFLAIVLRRESEYEEAELLSRQVLAGRRELLGPEYPATICSMGNLATILISQRKYDEAEPLSREALGLRVKVLGPDHPDTLINMGDLSLALANQHKYEEAEPMYRKVVAQLKKVLGPEHPTTLTCQQNFADLLRHQRHYIQGAILYERTHAGFSAVLGKDHPTTQTCYQRYSTILATGKRVEPATPLQIPSSVHEE